MSDNHGSKVNKGMKNFIYSTLVFFATAMIGVALLDPTFANDSSSGKEAQFSKGGIIAVGLSFAIAVAFSMWFSKRNKSE